MTRLKYELEGKRFGDLTVIRRSDHVPGTPSKWVCACKCGELKSIQQQYLVSGASRTCGCGIGRSATRRWEKKIRLNSRFGKLKVLVKTKQDRWGNWLYECRCDCGKTHVAKGTNLRCGKTKSCGCGQRESVTTHGKSQTLKYRRELSIQGMSKRRALEKKAGGIFTAKEVDDLLQVQDNECHYCGNDLDDFHRDHKIPLVRGGRNDIVNIALACPPCNLKKNRKTDDEFFHFLKTFEGTRWLSERNACLMPRPGELSR